MILRALKIANKQYKCMSQQNHSFLLKPLCSEIHNVCPNQSKAINSTLLFYLCVTLRVYFCTLSLLYTLRVKLTLMIVQCSSWIAITALQKPKCRKNAKKKKKNVYLFMKSMLIPQNHNG